MKESDIVISIFCPDKECTIFYESAFGPGYACSERCPKKEDMNQYIECFVCGEILELGNNHRGYERISHPHLDGSVSSMFSTGYERIFSRPEKD